MMRFFGAALVLALASGVAPLAAPAQTTMSLPRCTPAQLRLRLAPSDGAGMMHDTRFFVLTNVGATTCTVPGRPSLTIRDAAGAAIVADAGPPVPHYLHPGPVVLPLGLAPGDEVRTDARWAVDNGSGQKTNCFTAATATLAGATTRFATVLCGDDLSGAKPGVSLTRYERVRP